MNQFFSPIPRMLAGCVLISFVGATLTTTAIAEPPTKCTPDPMVLTIHDSYADPVTSETFTSNLRSDGRPYVNGEEGVEAILRSCAGESGDLTFRLAGSRKASRTYTLDLRNAVYTDSSTPAWVASPIVTAGGGTIANLLFNYSANSQYSFTTQIGLGGLPNPNYYFRMINPNADVTPVWGNTPLANQPCMTSLMHVTHYPAIGAVKEGWEIWSDSTLTTSCTATPLQTPIQVGTLIDSRVNWSGVGQFRIPIRITVQRK